MSDRPTYYLLSLGCSKNTVDSESMAQLLDAAGYTSVEKPRRADVLIVNTCGFISPAREESIRHLRALAARKRRDQVLIAAGCLAQLWGPALTEAVPGLDGVIGTRRWMDIVAFVEQVRARRGGMTPQPLYHLPTDALTVGDDEHGARRVAVQGASAYLKIADGCRRPCSFCTIPTIKGTLKSRPPERIVAEAQQLAAQGVREIILIAQDLTDYGSDLGMRDGLATLITQITQAAPTLDWLRLMYAYPGAITERLIEVMATNDKVVKYLDLPLQHAHPAVLRRMRRPSNIEWVYKTLDKMRAAMPELAVRTTFIVGFPGETDEEFEALLQFVEAMQFDRVGVFTYSLEPQSPSAALPNPVPAHVAEARREALMLAQQRISLRKHQQLVGRTLTVLIEGYDTAQNISVGRSYRDAPEVDGLVFVEGVLPVGAMVPVQITGAMAYDLVARPAIAEPRPAMAA
ncbi:MAG: 30S ribosomal protein S12 methylthiotransferase RimO [Thermoflexales bacterium]|nr:30S ribosomal protein S12 methylthiotransferase RimO [Thermoflexales bacterium]